MGNYSVKGKSKIWKSGTNSKPGTFSFTFVGSEKKTALNKICIISSRLNLQKTTEFPILDKICSKKKLKREEHYYFYMVGP
jgi:hypothetical protein